MFTRHGAERQYNINMKTTLILFSGLAGTGKSTLANVVARELKMPIISFDYFIDYALPRHMLIDPGKWTNQDVFDMMNQLAEQQLGLGVSVVLDAVYFSQASRDLVRHVAEKSKTRFCAIHTFCSDKEIWRRRVMARADNTSPDETPAKWETIIAELDEFDPWNEDDALFVDAICPIDENKQRVIRYLDG